jgi:hypothetical protein
MIEFSKVSGLECYDHLDGDPLKDGDKVRAYFPSGHVMETVIANHKESEWSHKDMQYFRTFNAHIVVAYYGVRAELSLKDHPEVKVERI